MTLLQAYMARTKITARDLAERTGLSEPMVTQIKLGKRRPSPETAMRIEAATTGEVTASALLGLSSGGGVRRRPDGKWVVEVDGEGRVVLPADLLADFGLEPGETLVFARTETGLRANSPGKAAREMQNHTRGLIAPGESVVDELIAERRAEAARE
jgi:transcriptional regulator with XRE-family HTH domain